MADACDLLGTELAIDRIDAVLARELPEHVRAFAHSYAVDAAPPSAPEILRRPATLAAALVACTHPLLADRGLALLRLIAPILVEDDPRVIAARACSPSWDGYAVLRAARDTAAHARFGHDLLTLMHDLHGVTAAGIGSTPGDAPGPGAGWTEPDVALDATAIRAAWDAIAALHGAHGQVTIVEAAVRPRAFVVAPGAEAIVVIPDTVATPAARFATLHELGHALAAVVAPHALPRVVDEAAAAYVARWMERDDGVLDRRWHSPLAHAARLRRTALAAQLDAIERGGPPAWSAPPWALWHDPGAQAAYVAAEAIAERLGGSPTGLGARLVDEHRRIDRATP